MNFSRRFLIPVAAIAALLCAPAAANAAWPGTPGKIAFFDREAEGVPLKIFTPEPNGAGGTKIAFAAQIDDPGFPGDLTHMAIFVWDWRTKTTTQVTTPPPGLFVPDSTQIGHQLTDYAPAWSPCRASKPPPSRIST